MALGPVVVDMPVLAVNLTGLSPYTLYECTVSASTGAGEGSASTPQTARTDEDGEGLAMVNMVVVVVVVVVFQSQWTLPLGRLLDNNAQSRVDHTLSESISALAD